MFKNVSEYIAHLEANEVPQAEIVATLKEITSRPVVASTGKRRGQLSGLALEDMTEEQLKREKINANSVLYKATQRGASEETVAANKARVDAVTARLEALKGAAKPAEAAPAEGTVEAPVVTEEVYQDEAPVTQEVLDALNEL
jgi:hypothetical protein